MLVKASAGIENAHPGHPFLARKVEGFRFLKDTGSGSPIPVHSTAVHFLKSSSLVGSHHTLSPIGKVEVGVCADQYLPQEQGCFAWAHWLSPLVSALLFPSVDRFVFPERIQILSAWVKPFDSLPMTHRVLLILALGHRVHAPCPTLLWSSLPYWSRNIPPRICLS